MQSGRVCVTAGGRNPRAQSAQCILLANATSLFQNFPWHPLRIRHGMGDVATRRRMFFLDLSQLLWSEAFREPYQGRPEAAVYESDPAVDEAADQYLFRLSDIGKDCMDAMALGMRPPAAPDGCSNDRLAEPRCGPFRRSKNDTVFPDEIQRLVGGRDAAHGGLVNHGGAEGTRCSGASEISLSTRVAQP